jgi:integral membrane protein (TIGR01906 family)
MLPTFTPAFYEHEYTKQVVDKSNPNIARRIYPLYKDYKVDRLYMNIERDELMKVTRHMLDYMKGKNDDMRIDAVVAGVKAPFFSERSVRHMVDVKKLFMGGFFLRNIALVALVVTILALMALKANALRVIAKSFRVTVVSFAVLVTALIVVATLNFEKAFVQFHHMFFDNDLWMLNGYQDLLVDMVPLGFFIDICIFIVSLLLLSLIVLFVVSNFILRKNGDNKANAGAGA